MHWGPLKSAEKPHPWTMSQWGQEPWVQWGAGWGWGLGVGGGRVRTVWGWGLGVGVEQGPYKALHNEADSKGSEALHNEADSKGSEARGAWGAWAREGVCGAGRADGRGAGCVGRASGRACTGRSGGVRGWGGGQA